MAAEVRVKSHVLDADGITKILTRIAHEILEQHKAPAPITLIGIRTRGEFLAQRIAGLIRQVAAEKSASEPTTVDVGVLDITLYRDDVGLASPNPIVHSTEVPFDVTDRNIIIVDDVLYTGRTIRAAMDALTDLGRPQAIEMAALIDRGHRELPIKANYIGKNLPTSQSDLVQVRLKESDGVDEVVIEEVTS